MTRIVLLLIVLLVPVFTGAVEVYRWVEADGVIHYSDRPQEGAELVIIQEAQTFSAPAPQATRSAATATGGKPADGSDGNEASQSYSTFEIVSPKQEEVLWNTGGELSVALRTRPRLRSGDTIVLFMDGQEVKQLARGRMQTQLSDVFRGTHSMYAEVRDSGGNAVTKSSPVQFTVQQTSIRNPNNPNVLPTPRGP